MDDRLVQFIEAPEQRAIAWFTDELEGKPLAVLLCHCCGRGLGAEDLGMLANSIKDFCHEGWCADALDLYLQRERQPDLGVVPGSFLDFVADPDEGLVIHRFVPERHVLETMCPVCGARAEHDFEGAFEDAFVFTHRPDCRRPRPSLLKGDVLPS